VEADASKESKRCLLKEIQWEPIKGKPIHVDFYAISRAHEIGMDIPINFVNTPLGVTKGGIFEPVLRELKVYCLLENMIDRIDIDVSPLDIGDSLHVKDLNLPAGIKVKLLEDEVVATVLPPSGEGESEGSGPTGPDAG
ncbi:MAG: 50S ribosomal protein L25, partial [Desulfatiglandales bacterium]